MPRLNKQQVLDEFEQAVRALAFKGAQMPGDHPGIEERYATAKANMRRCLQLPGEG